MMKKKYMNKIREYHRKCPPARVVDANDEYDALLTEEPHIEFSGEEVFGRYLDLHELYHQYINSNFGEPIEYSAYLDVLSQTDKIPRKLKMTRNSRVRDGVTIVIGGVGLLNDILENGAINMGCAALVYQIVKYQKQ